MGKRFRVLYFSILVLFSFFSGCKNSIDIEPRVRVIVFNDYMQDAKIEVYVESETGMSITGAFRFL